MVSITPILVDELQTHGFAGAIPDLREMPVVASAVLIDPQRAQIYFPPFHLANGLLTEVGEEMSLEEFEQLVRRNDATKLAGAPARSDGCFYFPPGDGSPEYTSRTTAAGRLAEFARAKANEGDLFLREGRRDLALRAYELAAATAQSPEYYARMLLVALPPKRKARILDALSQVATLRPPSLHVDRLRAQLR
jgi:hypothetical protein